MLPLLDVIDPNKIYIDLIMFNEMSIVQKMGHIMSVHYPDITVIQCTADIISLINSKIIKLMPYSEMSRFCKMVTGQESALFSTPVY